MTTQTVTIIFTDLVSSTELSSHLGPRAADDLRKTHFSLLRGAVAASGGIEVKNLGDGLMVAFTSLGRALACAVAMQQAIDRHNRRGEGAPLSVRVGVSAGEATEDDGDYFGDPVVEAARLCALADGGRILATAMVQILAGRHATQEFLPLGDLVLKGLPEAVPCVEVVWEPSRSFDDRYDGHLPLPTALSSASTEDLFAFFGRADELSRLADAQKASATEHRLRVILVSGEPGIGKTSLVAQATRSAHGAGANVLYGNCEEGLRIPYQPWIVALTRLVEQIDEAPLRRFVEANGPAVARLVPPLARRLDLPPPGATGDADTERFLIMEGVVRLLAAISAEVPLVVVLDDLHWMDATSIQLLRHLVTSATPMGVLVVGTFRDSDLSRAHPLTHALADLRRAPGVERLDLAGLGDTEITELLAAAAGHDVAGEGVAFAHALRRETDGNPFFLVEVIRHLAETGAFVRDAAGRWVLSTDLDDLSLPTSVREVVAHRVARLGEETEQVLSLAAVIGREFDVDILVRLTGTDEDRVLDVLEGAIGAGLVGETTQVAGRYQFVHALVQHTLYQELGATRRQRLHQRVAEALESGPGGDRRVAELARHWLAATRPSDAGKALHYARRAGEAALAAYAPLDAVGWYARALELIDHQGGDTDRERCALMIGLGTAQLQAGQPEHRETVRTAGEIARALHDRDLLVAVATTRSPPGAEAMLEADPHRLAVLDDALAAVGSKDSADRALLLACLAEEIDPGEVARRTALAADAIDVAERVGDTRTLLSVLCMTANLMSNPATVERRLRETTTALDLARQLGDVSAQVVAVLARVQVSAEVADLAAIDTGMAELETVVARTGLPYHRWVLPLWRGWRHLLAGRVSDAEADINEALEVGTQIGLGIAPLSYGAQILGLYDELGRLGEIEDLIVEVGREFPTLPGWRPTLAYLYSELGRHDEAATILDVDLATEFGALPFDVTWLQANALYADAAATIGHIDGARLLYERLLPYEGRFIFFGCLDRGAVGRPLGRLATLLGRDAEAEGHLRRALELHQAMESPYWVARTQLDLAELVMTRSADAAVGTALVDEVRHVADHYGYRALLQRVDRLSSAS